MTESPSSAPPDEARGSSASTMKVMYWKVNRIIGWPVFAYVRYCRWVYEKTACRLGRHRYMPLNGGIPEEHEAGEHIAVMVRLSCRRCEKVLGIVTDGYLASERDEALGLTR